jgi:membrane protein
VGSDHVGVVAAGVAFNVFLALFPMLIAAVSIYGLVADRAAVERQMVSLAGVLPPSALELVRGQLTAIAATPRQTLGWGAALSLLLVFWAASRGASALMEGLNMVYDERERRGFVRVRLAALAFSAGFVLFLLLGLALIAAAPHAIAWLGLSGHAAIAGRALQWSLLAVLVAALLEAVYRYGPSREPRTDETTAPGSLVAAVLWLAASAAFSWYAENFGRYVKTYGALAGVVVLLLWLHLSFFAILLGAEVNAAIERRRAARRA